MFIYNEKCRNVIYFDEFCRSEMWVRCLLTAILVKVANWRLRAIFIRLVNICNSIVAPRQFQFYENN